MERMSDWLRDPARSMSPDAVLAQPVTQLQGVGDAAAAALADTGVHTVLDLAAAALFSVARQVVEAADGEGPLALVPLPADLIDAAMRGKTAAEIAQEDIKVLRMLDAVLAERLQRSLPVHSIRDLALWPPARAARRILQIAYGGEDPAEDPEAPSELRPRMGRLPVERVTYERLYFEAPLGATAPAVENPPPNYTHGFTLDEGDSKSFEWPANLTDALLGRGFERPGIGLLVQVAQSWTPVGLALGQLQHSLALAPGEATRIAMIDWTRRVVGSTSENITEDEELQNSLARQRSVAEVTSMVASDLQKGTSGFSLTGASWGIGGGIAGGIDSGDKRAAAAVAFGYNRNDAQGSAMASSQGQRDIGTRLSQFVQDRSEQAASLTRSRRASVVSEVSVSEAERLSTRVVANYNHMHALSVLYFEVVQIYRLSTEIEGVDPLLYLPVKPLDFADTSLLERYRGVLAEVALNARARTALLGIEEEKGASTPVDRAGLATLICLASTSNPTQAGASLDSGALKTALGAAAEWKNPELRLHSSTALLSEVRVGGWHNEQGQPMGPLVQSLARVGTQGVTPWGFTPWATARDLRYSLKVGESDTPYCVEFDDAAMRLESLRALNLTLMSGTLAKNLRVALVFHKRDVHGRKVGEAITIEGSIGLSPGQTEVPLLQVRFKPDTATAEVQPVTSFDLQKHLQVNALHYTMALLRRADPALLGLFLGQAQIGGLPLLGQVDAQPIAHVGNYLVFRCPAVREQAWWKELVSERGLGGRHRRDTLVPMPTGSVFAEAVLGRFNSAEKLDLTRFWNWQDSPMPLVPPEIAALTAGGRNGANAPEITGLGAANLRQMEALTLPEAGKVLDKALELAAKGDAFRDMSGLGSLLTQGGTALSLSAQGAKEFMSKAMETVTAYGARINEGKKMDEEKAKTEAEKAKAAEKNGGTPGPVPGGTSGPGGNPTSPSAPAPVLSNTKPSLQEKAFLGPEASQSGESKKVNSASTEPVLLALLLRVLEQPQTRESANESSSAQQQSTLNLTGSLDLLGPASVESPDGAWPIDIEGGVGSISARRKTRGQEVLKGTLRVGSLTQAQWSVVSDVAIPELPADWLDNRLAGIENLGVINAIPITGLVLPAMTGETELAIDLNLAVGDAFGVARQIELGGLTDFSATLAEKLWIDLTGRFAGNTATETELTALLNAMVNTLSQRRRQIYSLVAGNHGVRSWPVLACEVDYFPSSKQICMTPRWVFIFAANLVLRR